MDPILSAKSTNMADAFTCMMGILQGPKGPEKGRIHKRNMVHNQNSFVQYIFHERDEAGTYRPVRWLSVEFRQWDGFFYVYTHTTDEIAPYLPHKKGHIHQGFNYAKFTLNSSAELYTLDMIEQAVRESLSWLTGATTKLPRKDVTQTHSVLRRIMDFKNFFGTSGKIYLNVSDLGTLLEK